MIIRQAQMADLDAIYAIELENFSPEEAVSRESLAAHIQTLSSTFLVAEKDGKILGYLEGPVRPERYLKDISFTEEIEDYGHLEGGFISLTSHDYLTAYYEKHAFVNEGLSKSTYAGASWFDMVWENPSLKLQKNQ